MNISFEYLALLPEMLEKLKLIEKNMSNFNQNVG